MFFVDGLGGEPKPDHRDESRTCVGKVVEGVCDDGDGSGKKPHRQFSDAKQNVHDDARHGRKRRMRSAYAFIF